jgi:hypothetical protein
MSSVPPPNWQPSAMPAPASAGPPDGPASARRLRPSLILGLIVAAGVAGGAFALFGSSATKLTDPIAEAATLSSNTAGYRMHMALEFTSSGLPTPITGVGDGRFDVRDRTGEMSLAMNLGNEPQIVQALGGGTLRMTEIVDGTTVYMKLPGAAAGALGALGQRWLKLDVAKSAHLPGLSSIGSNPATTNPGQMLQFLRAVSDSVVTEGRQRVDGFETTHYHAELSLSSIASALPAADQAAAQQVLSGLEQSAGLHTIPVDVWVDARHLVRRMQMSMNAAVAGGQTMDVALTADISDYGPQPRPTLPPADQVQDMSSLVAAATGQ